MSWKPLKWRHAVLEKWSSEPSPMLSRNRGHTISERKGVGCLWCKQVRACCISTYRKYWKAIGGRIMVFSIAVTCFTKRIRLSIIFLLCQVPFTKSLVAETVWSSLMHLNIHHVMYMCVWPSGTLGSKEVPSISCRGSLALGYSFHHMQFYIQTFKIEPESSLGTLAPVTVSQPDHRVVVRTKSGKGEPRIPTCILWRKGGL